MRNVARRYQVKVQVRPQKGFTILELLIAVAVSSLMFVALATSNRYEGRKLIGKRMGESYKPMAQALQDYIQAHRLRLVQGLPVTGVSNAFQPTIAELRALNYYSANYPLTIPSNGGAPVFRIARIPAGCVTTACDLEYFVGNTVPELGDDGAANEGVLASAAATVGATAGYSKSLTPSVITGQGGWAYANPNGAVSGIFGIYTTYSQSGNNAFVRMQDIRDPDLQGNLTVAGATKANTLDVAATAKVGKMELSDTATQGVACSPSGMVSKDSYGQVLSCQSGIWSATGSGGAWGFAYRTFDGGYWYTTPNPKTGSFSCPPGYTAVGGLMGQAWQNSAWDTTIHHYNCV